MIIIILVRYTCERETIRGGQKDSGRGKEIYVTYIYIYIYVIYMISYISYISYKSYI
jgi:hypothetical protein